MLLTGPFGGLTDDVREFLCCLADEGLPLTGWGDLDQASLRTVRERLPGAGGRPRRPGPCSAADQPAAVAVRRRPAHRGRGRAAPADRPGPRVPRPARRRPARLRLRRLVGRGRLGRLGTPGRARPAALARARHPGPGAGRPAARTGRPGRLRQALRGPGRPPLAVDAGRRRPGRVAPGPLVDRPGPSGHAGRPRHPGPHVALAGLVRPHRHRPRPDRGGRRHVRPRASGVSGRRHPELSPPAGVVVAPRW